MSDLSPRHSLTFVAFVPTVRESRIGLAAGIIFDATVIRAVLVPSIMRLIGRWNWWLPTPVARFLLLPRPAVPEPAPEPA